MDSIGGIVRLRRDAAQVAEAVMLAVLWLMLCAEALGQWLVGRWLMLPRRSRAQGTLEILIGMAVLGVLALAVWRVIAPAIMARATGVATDLQTAGTGANGTGN